MLLAAVTAAWADPDVTRVPAEAVAASVGSPGVSAMVWWGQQGLGVGWGAGALSAFAAARTPIRTGWGAGVTAGLAVPVADPGLAIETAGWIGPSLHGRHVDLGLDLVVPAAASVTDGVARVGVRLEPRVGAHFGWLLVSLSGGGGVLVATDSGWAMDLRATVGIGAH